MHSKKAYPNYDESINFINPRDTQKWVGIATTIYSEVHGGKPRSQAVEKATSDLDKMEKIDFLNWLKFLYQCEFVYNEKYLDRFFYMVLIV